MIIFILFQMRSDDDEQQVYRRSLPSFDDDLTISYWLLGLLQLPVAAKYIPLQRLRDKGQSSVKCNW